MLCVPHKHSFRERRRYRIDLKTKVCTVEHSDMRFRPWHIPRDAEFVGDAYVGTNAFLHSGVLTTHWNHRNKTENTDWYGVFTDRDVGCVPVCVPLSLSPCLCPTCKKQCIDSVVASID